MKRNVSVDRFKFRCNILIGGKIIKEMPGSVASGKHCIRNFYAQRGYISNRFRVYRGKYTLKCLLTCLLSPWCRVLLEKLTGLQLVKKFPAFHGTRRFITALTSVRQPSLSWASPIQFIYPHPISWRSVLILSIHLRLGLPSGLLPSSFRSKTLYTPPLSLSP